MGISDSKLVHPNGRNLWKAAKSGNVNVTRSILSDPSQYRRFLNWEHPNQRTTPLMMACRRGKIKIVKLLVDAGTDINRRDSGSFGNTALHYAAYKNKIGAMRILLRCGCDPYIWNKKGHSALDLARFREHREAVALLSSIFRVHQGWLYIFSKNAAVINTWRRRWCEIIRSSPDGDRTELVTYSGSSEVKPHKIILINPTLNTVSSVSKFSWKDRSHMFSFDEATTFQRMILNGRSFSRSNQLRQRQHTYNREFRFAAENGRELSIWLNAFRNPSEFFYSLHEMREHDQRLNNPQSFTSEPYISMNTIDRINHDNTNFVESNNTSSNNIDHQIDSNESTPEVDENAVDRSKKESSESKSSNIELKVDDKERVGSIASMDEDCIVCMDAIRNAVCVPCGHVAGCYNCLTELQVKSGCPICRASISSVMKIYAC